MGFAVMLSDSTSPSSVPPSEDGVRVGSMDVRAGEELAQELSLVTRSLFGQLLPGSADHALSGVPGLEGRKPTRQPPASSSAAAVTLVTANGSPPTTRHNMSVSAPPIELPEAVSGSLHTPADSAVLSTEAQLPLVPALVSGVSEGSPLPLIEAIEAIEAIEVLDVLEEIPAVPVLRTAPLGTHPPQTDRRSQAMLAEISFLDEDEKGND